MLQTLSLSLSRVHDRSVVRATEAVVAYIVHWPNAADHDGERQNVRHQRLLGRRRVGDGRSKVDVT
jgi:hypothetical protein